jgi:DNA helicase HerA-like ATPase
MQILLGTNAENKNEKIILDTQRTINGHTMIVGASGTGKTYNLRKLIRNLVKNPKVQVSIIDVHGDIEVGDDITSSVTFSETSNVGLPFLNISSDPDFGGVRKKIQSVLATINRTSRKLQSKQESTFRNLLIDLYAINGFYSNRPDSWDINNEIRKNPRHKKRYPSIEDLKKITEYKLKQMIIGGNQEAVAKFEELSSKVKSLHKNIKKSNNDSSFDLEPIKEKCIESYKAALDAIKSGQELDQLIKYDSKDVLKSVYERIVNLESSGIFKNKTPEFDLKKQVRRYNIKSLNKDEQKMFVDVLLEEIYFLAKQNGEQSEPLNFIVIDEAHMFITEEDEHIINIIAKEARKFGVALILASQAFTHFSDDIIQATMIKIILGIDEMFYKSSAAKLDISPKRFSRIIPQTTAMIQIKNKKSIKNQFIDVLLN